MIFFWIEIHKTNKEDFCDFQMFYKAIKLCWRYPDSPVVGDPTSVPVIQTPREPDKTDFCPDNENLFCPDNESPVNGSPDNGNRV